MDAVRLGRSIRALRLRQGKRQEDAASAAGCSRGLVAKIERGDVRSVTFGEVDRVCQALGADFDPRIRWHGEGLDRLLDEPHARLVDAVVALLQRLGWECRVEVTFNEYGERGSVDVVAWHAASSIVLVVEVKSVVPDAQGTLMPLDRKARLGLKIARQCGWAADHVARLLVVGDNSTNRRRIGELHEMFDVAFPIRGWDLRRWLRAPVRATSGLLFLSYGTPGSVRKRVPGRHRVSRVVGAPRGRK